MRMLILCLSCLLASVNGLYEQFFQIDLEGLLKDETQMKALFNCLIYRGSCENFRVIKDTAPLLFFNKCEGCTAEQKEIFDKTIYNLARKYPKEYAELTKSHPLPILREGEGLDEETEKLFNVDFTMLLTNKTHSRAVVDCLVDRGSCEDYQYIKATVPKVIYNKCKGCTEEQKEVFDWTIHLIIKLYPEEMANFTASLEKNPPCLSEGEEELLKMNFTSLLQDKKELVALVDCLMDRGPCEKFQPFKTAGPKLLKDNCKRCTPEQKNKFENAIKQFAKKYPKGYAEIVYKIHNPLEGGEYDELFKIDFEKIINDKEELEAVYKCLMGSGSCENYKTIQDLLPKCLISKCAGCTPDQINIYEKLLGQFEKHYPAEHKELLEKLASSG